MVFAWVRVGFKDALTVHKVTVGTFSDISISKTSQIKDIEKVVYLHGNQQIYDGIA